MIDPDAPTADLEAAREQITAILTARWAAQTAQDRAEHVKAQAEEALDRIAASWHATEGGTGTVEDPRQWVQPQGAHDVWPLGSIVTHSERMWKSRSPNNAWMPGDPADPQTGRWWKDITNTDTGDDPDDGPDAWEPWTDYAVGDVRTYGGLVYRARQGHYSQPGSEPPKVSALWEPIEGEP